MKQYIIQFTVAVVMTFWASACSDKNSTSNSIEDNTIRNNSENKIEDTIKYDCIKEELQNKKNECIPVKSLKDLNHDGIKDSLLYDDNWKEDEEKFSIFFGRKDGGYDLIKEYTYGKECSRAPFIVGDTMLISGRGYSYAFKYRNDQFIFVGYDVHINGYTTYELDFDNKKIIYRLDNEFHTDGDQCYILSVDMPEDKIIENYSLDTFFDPDGTTIYKYVDYEDKFHELKIDSFARSINSKF